MELALVGVAVAAFLARVSLFGEGGTVGAWASVIVFWVSLLALLAVSMRPAITAFRAGDRIPLVQWAVGVLCVVLLVVGDVAKNNVVNDASIALVLLGLLSLIAISIGRWRTGPAA